MTDTLPLHLDESLLIGAGSHRKCYQHPSNPALCIKITINSVSYTHLTLPTIYSV